ncbi:MAG TPA: hypothetical protein VJR89_39535, partial [Polyangiales bacterium]|nr:hypothetical protein [Polyangiales bacterium]
RTIALAAWDEVCGIAESGEIRCHNFDSMKTIPLQNSENAVAVRGAGGLSACGKNGTGLWQCWNVLPPLLEVAGSTPVPIRTEMPIDDLVIGGFHVCALRADRSVACADASKIGLMPLPEYAELNVVPGLPL